MPTEMTSLCDHVYTDVSAGDAPLLLPTLVNTTIITAATVDTVAKTAATAAYCCC
jgi:hypothetical protein